MKPFSVETTGERNDVQGAVDCPGRISYKGLLGALLRLSQETRPDITYAVSQCAKFVQKPRMANWWALKRILRYLKGTVDYGINYQRQRSRDQSTTLGSVNLPMDTFRNSLRGRREDCSSLTTPEMWTPTTPTLLMIENLLQATSTIWQRARYTRGARPSSLSHCLRWKRNIWSSRLKCRRWSSNTWC